MILESPARMASRLKRLKQSMHFMNLMVQVTATTIGILIALGLDQMKVARQNRRNAAQALGFIVSDMEANQRRLANTLESFGNNEKTAMDNLEFLQSCRQRKLAPKGKGQAQDFPTLSLTILQSASWETAVASQAASHLDMQRVQKLAAIFELQRKYEEAQSDLLRKGGIRTRFAVLNGEPGLAASLSNAEVRSLEYDLIDWYNLLQNAKVLGEALQGAYKETIPICGS